MPQTKRNTRVTKVAPRVVRELVYDTKKTLKGGKRRHVDQEDKPTQSEYLSAEEVLKLGSPDAITVTIEQA